MPLSGWGDWSQDSIARMYRTVIRSEMSRGANFAGHYRVAIWGCGTSCAQFAAVNLNTGRVITVQGIHSVSGIDVNGVFAEADDFLTGTDSECGFFRFKRNSRLLVLVGAINENPLQKGALQENDRVLP